MALSRPSTPENPALNPDGTLKDASEMQWFHSPSDAQPMPPAPSLEASSIPAPNFGAPSTRPQRLRRPTEKAAAALEADDSEDDSAKVQPTQSKPTSTVMWLPLQKPATIRAGERRADPAPARRRTSPAPSSNRLRQTLSLRQTAPSAPSTSAAVGPTKSLPAMGRSISSSSGALSVASGSRKRKWSDASSDQHTLVSTTSARRSSDSLVLVNIADDDDDEDEYDQCLMESDTHSDSPSHTAKKQRNTSGSSSVVVSSESSEARAGNRSMPALSRLADDRTADLRLIFQPEDVRDGQTGVLRKGWLCLACKANGHKNVLIGNVTARRTHIQRRHSQVYQKRCKEAGIIANWRCVESEVAESSIRQSVLEDYATPRWTKEGLLDCIVQMCVEEDQAFRLIDQPSFRNLITYQRPQMQDGDLPHRTKLRSEIFGKEKALVDRLCALFRAIRSRISLTFDTWTSASSEPYLALTAHFITAPNDRPSQWELKYELIGFIPYSGDHSGENQARHILRCLDKYDLRSKVGWLTSDNAANNDTTMRFLENPGKINDDFLSNEPLDDGNFNAIERRGRCGSHFVHLSAKHFVEDALPKKAKGDADALSSLVGDHPLIKLIALTNQIRASPQAQAFFAECTVKVGAPSLAMKLWVRTRWGSLCGALHRALILEKAVDVFTMLADSSPAVPNLRGRHYADFALSRDDWAYLRLLHEVLKIPDAAQQIFSAETQHTVYRVYPVIECMLSDWSSLADDPRFKVLKRSIRVGIESLKKYRSHALDFPPNIVCLVLNPEVKFTYFLSTWSPSEQKKARELVWNIFKQYHARLPPLPPATSVTHTTDGNAQARGYGSDWMRRATRKTEHTVPSLSSDELRLREFGLYADSNVVDNVQDLPAWWGVQSTTYRTWGAMAQDFLAVQGSAVPCERAFSSSGLTSTKRRNLIAPDMFQALQLLKHAYRTSSLSADGQEDGATDDDEWVKSDLNLDINLSGEEEVRDG